MEDLVAKARNHIVEAENDGAVQDVLAIETGLAYWS